VKIINKLENQ